MAPMSPVQPQKLEDIYLNFSSLATILIVNMQVMRLQTRQQGLSLKYTPPSYALQHARSQESHGSDLTESKGESADVGRQPGLKMLAALCLASAVEGHNGGKPGMGCGKSWSIRITWDPLGRLDQTYCIVINSDEMKINCFWAAAGHKAFTDLSNFAACQLKPKHKKHRYASL